MKSVKSVVKSSIAVILQARMSSRRLPGKVLLPVAGMPVVVLAARRAANRGLNVIVATSTEASNDSLARTVEEAGIRVVRGPLDDVLSRFILAARELPDEATLVRLTADNVFPDGEFLAEMVAAFERGQQPYLVTGSPAEGVPYGLSAEVFTAGALRKADRHASTAFDREHVTPWLRRQAQRTFVPAAFAGTGCTESGSYPGDLRCTIDSTADYELVARVFEGVADPVGVPWLELVQRQAAGLPRPRAPRRSFEGQRRSELTLGTAQLGLPDYGRVNVAGQPALPAAVQLVREAVSHGVDCLDTARAYGTAESVLGEALAPYGGALEVVTKLDPLAALDERASLAEVHHAVEESVRRSCEALRTARLPVLLLHRWTHRRSHGGEIWKRLLAFRDAGVIDRLGASVYTPAEATEALSDHDINHLQLPFNVLDHRWASSQVPELASRRPDVAVHARSVLLQGLLGATPEHWPAVPGVDAAGVVAQLEALARELGRANRVDLCLAFARSQNWIHSLVLGVETSVQLKDLLHWFQQPALTLSQAERVTRQLARVPDALLNPTLWPAK